MERILSSAHFRHAGRLSQLLRYIVERTLAGNAEQIKEYTLGVAVFGRSDDYDPRTDPIVRVEMGRLRSKLAEYYASEGRQEPVLIELPKGRYSAVFQHRKLPQPRPWDTALDILKRRKRGATILAVGLVLGWGLAHLPGLKGRPAPPAPAAGFVDAFWSPFLSPKADTTIVFSSPLFFELPEHALFLRFYNLNEPNQIPSHAGYHGLRRLLGEFSGPYYNYAQIGEALSIARLVGFLARRGASVTAVPAHAATWDFLKERNVIILGAARMNQWLRRLESQLDFAVTDGPAIANRRPQPGEQKIYETPSHRDAKTYAVVATLPGLSPGRGMVVVSSHGSAGIVGAVEFILNPERMKELEAKLGPRGVRRTADYQILLEIISDKDEVVKTAYVTHHAIARPRYGNSAVR
jgi:hypothetical protein